MAAAPEYQATGTSVAPQRDSEEAAQLTASAQLRSSSEQPRSRREAPAGPVLPSFEWTAEDVGDWIDDLLGSGCGAAFREQKVDGPTLLEFTENDQADEQLLSTMLRISDPIHRKKILGRVREAKRRAALPPASPEPRTGSGARATSAQRQLQRADYLARSADSLALDGERSIRSMSNAVQVLSKCTRYRIPSKSNASLNSSFGLDSPSFSVRGSWSPPPPRGRAAPMTTPGPAAYAVNHDSFKTNSPRAAFSRAAKSSRADHWLPTSATVPTASTQLFLTTAPSKVKGGTIGTATRFRRKGDVH